MSGSQNNNAVMLEPLRHFIKDHDLEAISVVASDMNGIPRGKKIPARRILESDSSPMRISNLMHMLDMGSFPYLPPEGDDRWWPSWSEGYTDTRAIIDSATMRLVPWQDKTGLVICDFEHVNGMGTVEYFPRQTLKRLIKRLADYGFETFTTTEMEFILYDETNVTAREKNFQDLKPLWSALSAYCLTTLGYQDEIITDFRNYIEGFGLTVEAWGVEAGPGQVEMNISPKDALTAADEGFLFKHAVKEIAATKGLFASFIPKTSVMGFGNGSHLNFSLWKDGRNAFHSGNQDDPRSDVMKKFVSGMTKSLRELTLMYAPCINSYRRFVPYYSNGMTVSWGGDNKSLTNRTITETEKLTRVEQRTAGADVNPYIQIAACIAGGLYGLENDIDIAPTEGDAYSNPDLEKVPMNIEEAIELFEQSEMANEYLGEDFVRFYAQGRKVELQNYQEAMTGIEDGGEVTAWELNRYFEVV